MRAMHLATMAGAAIWVHAAAAQSPMLLRSGVASNPTPIQHIIVIMQENRSFDSYFGTYPGANGIPAGVCVPLAVTNPSAGCVVPFHNPLDINQGGPHGANNATGDIDDGVISQKMDGFVTQQIAATKKNRPSLQVTEGALDHDVMGYHTAAEIPNYWTYAQNFVLQDNLFASERGWSLPNHLYLASEWSAICKDWTNAMTCASSDGTGTASFTTPNGLPWVNLFQLFDQYGVSWKYYLGQGTEPDCEDDAMTCAPVKMIGKSPSMWNAPPWFHYVKQQGPAYLDQHNPSLDQFLVDVGKGSLPQVSWLVPSGDYSEHPASGITVGMEYVTSAVNAVMQSPYWANTVIFISWDDWGGFYDHVPPPSVTAVAAGENLTGYGLRVPGIMISAYARQGMIDHQLLSFDNYARLAEDLFMGGVRLDPAAMGIPDNRPVIRDGLTNAYDLSGDLIPVGDLLAEFDFSQTPLPPVVLSTHIPVDIQLTCGTQKNGPGAANNCTVNKVHVTWKPVRGFNVTDVFVYHVLRDGVALTGCVTTASSCQDVASPGVHLYTVYSVDPSGIQSPVSAAAEADVPAG